MRRILILTPLFTLIFAALAIPQPAYACGGMFSPNNTIAQNAERMIFIDNGDGTTSEIIQIQYTGEAEEFAWVLPIPQAITADDIQVIEDGNDAFRELELASNPQFFPPSRPDCFQFSDLFSMGAAGGARSAPDGVQVLERGIVGPFGFDVISSEDPAALIGWLQEHRYQVSDELEPMLATYLEAGMVFLAMRLLPGENASAVQPIMLTWPSAQPMIRLRMSALSAVPDTNVIAWFFSQSKTAVPVNFETVDVPLTEMRFYDKGGNNYTDLMSQAIDEAGGHAFVVEYAGDSNLTQTNPYFYDYTSSTLLRLMDGNNYLTRLNMAISPEEMTADPIFEWRDPETTVSNFHDLRQLGLGAEAWDYQCVISTSVGTALTGLVCLLSVGLVIFGAVRLFRRRRAAAPA